LRIYSWIFADIQFITFVWLIRSAVKEKNRPLTDGFNNSIMAWSNRDGRPYCELMRRIPRKPTTGILYAFGVYFKRVRPPKKEDFFMANFKESRGKGRTRNFATVVYPDSAPENWQEILSEMRVPCFISPLHDKDVNPDGEIKKPHWHVQFVFDSVKTDEQVQEIIDTIGGVGLERINSYRGYARYLCHLDNPEKHQYLPEEVRSLCGADYIGAIGLVTDKYKAIGEMIDFCMEKGIDSYMELIVYARNERQNWFRVLCDNGTVVIKEFLKSKTWTEANKASPRP
jgi:hypothetical protein